MKTILAQVAALSMMVAIPAHATSFLGDTLNQTLDAPNQGTVAENDGDQTVAPTATFHADYNFMTTTVTGNTITVQPTSKINIGFFATSFNGLVLTDLTNSKIANVTLDSSSTLSGFTQSDISFTGNTISLNFEDLTLKSGQAAVVDVSFVPEPASWALMIVGFAGLGATLRQRRPAIA